MYDRACSAHAVEQRRLCGAGRQQFLFCSFLSFSLGAREQSVFGFAKALDISGQRKGLFFGSREGEGGRTNNKRALAGCPGRDAEYGVQDHSTPRWGRLVGLLALALADRG